MEPTGPCFSGGGGLHRHVQMFALWRDNGAADVDAVTSCWYDSPEGDRHTGPASADATKLLLLRRFGRLYANHYKWGKKTKTKRAGARHTGKLSLQQWAGLVIQLSTILVFICCCCRISFNLLVVVVFLFFLLSCLIMSNYSLIFQSREIFYQQYATIAPQPHAICEEKQSSLALISAARSKQSVQRTGSSTGGHAGPPLQNVQNDFWSGSRIERGWMINHYAGTLQLSYLWGSCAKQSGTRRVQLFKSWFFFPVGVEGYRFVPKGKRHLSFERIIF